ncbi:MAG: hypothetical protein LBJ03_01560 [Holosporales bacterium]|nr:hypothetical protein [Holosporales bacterium]
MSNELPAELPSYITKEDYDQRYQIFDEVLETHEAIADESHFYDLAIWLINKKYREQAEKAAEEGGELSRDYAHLYGYKVGVCYPAADEKAVWDNMEFFLNALPGKKELLKQRTDNFKKFLDDCRDNSNKILACIKEKGLCDAISCFITDKTRSADEARNNIACRLGRVLLRREDVSTEHMAYLYPLEDKYRHMSTYKKDDLPYICYGVSLTVAKPHCWILTPEIPPSFDKLINDIREIIDSATESGELPVKYNKVMAKDFVLFIRRNKETDSDFPIPLPEWLRKKANITDSSERLSLPELDYVRFINYSATEKFKGISAIAIKDLGSAKKVVDVLKKQGFSVTYKEDKRLLVFSFQSHKEGTDSFGMEEVEITLNLLKQIITLLKGSKKCLEKIRK